MGLRLGAESPMNIGEEDEYGVKVKKEKVKEAIEKVMIGEQSGKIRDRAKEYAEKAKKAMHPQNSQISFEVERLAQAISEMLCLTIVLFCSPSRYTRK